MKRFVSILLVAMLIVTSLATVAFAAGAASVSGNTKNANAGDEVTLTFTVKGEFANYEMTLNYDQTVLTLTGFGNIVGNTANGKVAHATAENVASHSFTATFKVSESAKAGTYYVTPAVSFVSDRDLVDCTVSASSGAIVIACNHTYGGWTVTKEATCTAKGEQTRTCSKCGHVETKEIAMKAHTLGGWEKDSKNHWHVCSVCKNTFDCAAHTWKVEANDGWETVKPATKDEDGQKMRACSVCNYTEYDVIYGGEPEMGDITGQVTMGATAVLLLVVASVAFVFKRKTAK